MMMMMMMMMMINVTVHAVVSIMQHAAADKLPLHC
jgi:hypothetical protein